MSHHASPRGKTRQPPNTDTRPRLRLLEWAKKYDLTRDEWEAVKACADQMERYRRWLMKATKNRNTGQRDVWTRPSPDDVLTDQSGHSTGSLRSSQLAQVAMEVCYHRGVRLSDYKWKVRKEQRRREARERSAA